MRRRTPPPAQVASVAELVQSAADALHTLAAAEPRGKMRPSLRATELGHIADAIEDFRRQLLELYSVK